MEETPGTPDNAGELEAYAQEVYDAYGDDDWPFGGAPIVQDGFVQQVIKWTERAKRRHR